MKNTFIPILLLFCIGFTSLSNNTPITFGKVSIDELNLQLYEPDTSASIIVLHDYGYFHSDEFRFIRTLRLKIIKKEGYNWLESQCFTTPEQTVVRGRITSLNHNKIVQTKIRNSSIDKKIVYNNFYTFRFSLPQKKIGSIIDLEFMYKGIPFEWLFQLDIPVKWSEIVIQESPFLTYREKISGYEPLHIHEKGRWAVKNIPAFKREPYMSTEINFKTKIEFEIIDVNYFGYEKKLPTTWKRAFNYLEKNENFGGALRGSLYLNDIARQIKNKFNSKVEKLQYAFNIAKNIHWNKKETIYSSSSFLNTIYKKKVGNSADINMILIQLLNKLGFNAYPIILSTRENGYVTHTFPLIHKLNHIMAYTKIGKDQYFLDATDQYVPINLIPKKCLNGSGRLLFNNKTKKVNLKPPEKRKELIVYNLHLKKDLTMNGTVVYKKFHYAALKFRKKYNKYKNHRDYLNEFEKEKSGIKIVNSKLSNLNNVNLPIIEEFNIIVEKQVNNINGKIHLLPLLFDKPTRNPFSLEKRKYPIDLIYPIEKKYIIKISIPENFQITQIPQSINKILTNNSVQFNYLINKNQNILSLTYKYSINKLVFSPNEYESLKKFFQQILDKLSEPIILHQDKPIHTMKTKSW